MIRTFFKRSFHVQCTLFVAKTEKSALARLRSKTGFAISNCKKALVMHNDDYEKALVWLNEQAQKEGWIKAEKLQGRSTAQGLIGLFSEKNGATIVEVNCETDFVARNKEFKNLVSSITRICHSHNIKDLSNSNGDYIKKIGNCEQLLSATIDDRGTNKSLSDMIALKIGFLGENMTLRRVLSVKVADNIHIGCYTHPIPSEPTDKNDNLLFGKFGSFVAFKKLESESITKLTEKQYGKQLAQHVIGMRPQSIGSPYVPAATSDVVEEKEETTPKSTDVEDEEMPTTISTVSDDESRMLYQEFLSDSSVTVGDFIYQNGIEILDFVRFECGETSTDL